MVDEMFTYTTSVQKIQLRRIQTEGLILDIGGGGEGLVSRIEGGKVCAVDIRMSEIREARIHDPPANWFVGDGRSLGFQDSIFDVVTLWFSLGYMSEMSIKERVFAEAHRVLKQGGVVSLLSSKIAEGYDLHVFWANFTLPDGTISQTGYGVRGGQNQNLDSISKLLTKSGFLIRAQEDNGDWFIIEAVKS